MAEFHNRTRRSASLPVALLKRGRLLALPLYYALRASDLAREGLDNSGSYRFADHIYRGHPAGRGPLGRWIDARLLAMPAVRSFRNRYLAAREIVSATLADRVRHGADVHVLSVPCGIPRELVDGARLFSTRGGSLDGVTFHGLDLDPDVLAQASRCASEGGLPRFVPHHGDALERATYPAVVDLITCTGLGEFLDDGELERLYRVFFDVLRPGGTLFTTGMGRRWLADYLLRLAELDVTYRGAADLTRLLERASFTDVRAAQDDLGIQTIVTARR